MPDNNSGTPSRHRLKHIRIEAFKSVATFAPPKRKIANSTPDREIHGLKLRHELAAAFLSAHALAARRATKDRAVCLVIKRLPSDYCHHIRKCGNYHKCQCKQVGPQNSARSKSQSY
jgi:hypothetical protein